MNNLDLSQDENTISIDPMFKTISHTKKGEVSLTIREFQIFAQLLSAPNNIQTREQLNRSVWRNTNVSRKTLDVHICNLRKKILPLGMNIKALRCANWVFELFGAEGCGRVTFREVHYPVNDAQVV